MLSLGFRFGIRKWKYFKISLLKMSSISMDKKSPYLRILVDMDGVVADFERGLLNRFRHLFPNDPYIPLNERRGFFASDNYERLYPGSGIKVQEILQSEGFFRNLLPIEGAIESLLEMKKLENVDIFFCSSPLLEYHHCVLEKFQWIEEKFGPHWLDKIILTRDKTIMSADLLIDDNAHIEGVEPHPLWQQVVFTAPYNIEVTQPEFNRINSWKNPDEWRKIIEHFRTLKILN